MTSSNTTNDRLKTIVRKAQRNFQFSSIYEQRKTNQILIAGFNNLAQAIDGLGDKIVSSINDLRAEISAMSSSMQKTSAEAAARHDKTLEILDNIQRHRKPIGDRLFESLNTERAP